jgi:hypothetical protein
MLKRDTMDKKKPRLTGIINFFAFDVVLTHLGEGLSMIDSTLFTDFSNQPKSELGSWYCVIKMLTKRVSSE